jgi:hypothetical protein
MAHPKANKRNTSQKALDDLQIEQWLIQCKTEQGITAALNEIRPYQLSRSQIHCDIVRLRNGWRAETAQGIAKIKERDLKTLDKLSDVAWTAYERSTKDAVVETSKVKGTPAGIKGKVSGSSVEKASRKEGQCGDPQYLRVILDVQKRRSELLGLNAPTKTELTGLDGGPIGVAAIEIIGGRQTLPKGTVVVEEVENPNGTIDIQIEPKDNGDGK